MISETPQSEPIAYPSDRRRFAGAFVSIALVLGFLFLGDLYLLSKLGAARRSIIRLESELRSQITDVRASDDELTAKIATLERHDTEQVEALRKELDVAAGRLGSNAGQTLDRARLMVAKLQKEQRSRVDDLERQLSLKVDDGDLDDLNEEMTAEKTDIRSTQDTVGALAKDLGSARSELGLLEMRNRGDLDTLQKAHDRDYREFNLIKNERTTLYGVGLVLKKVNLKHRRYSLELLVNDLTLRNDDQNVGQPIFFYLPGSQIPCEVVATWIDGHSIKGYLSVPRTLAQLQAGRAGG